MGNCQRYLDTQLVGVEVEVEVKPIGPFFDPESRGGETWESDRHWTTPPIFIGLKFDSRFFERC